MVENIQHTTEDTSDALHVTYMLNLKAAGVLAVVILSDPRKEATKELKNTTTTT